MSDLSQRYEALLGSIEERKTALWEAEATAGAPENQVFTPEGAAENQAASQGAAGAMADAAGRAAADVGQGALEAPQAVARGVTGAAGDLHQAVLDLGTWLADGVANLLGIGGAEAPTPQSPLKTAQGAIPAPTSNTGYFLESMTGLAALLHPLTRAAEAIPAVAPVLKRLAPEIIKSAVAWGTYEALHNPAQAVEDYKKAVAELPPEHQADAMAMLDPAQYEGAAARLQKFAVGAGVGAAFGALAKVAGALRKGKGGS